MYNLVGGVGEFVSVVGAKLTLGFGAHTLRHNVAKIIPLLLLRR